MNISINHEICIMDAPAIPGLHFRGFQGESDYPNIVACLQACKDVDQLERPALLEDISNQYRHLTNCEPYQDMIFAEINGQVVGYSRVDWRQEQPSLDRIYASVGYVQPAWRRRGLGRAMLHFCEERLRQIASAHPQDGGRFFDVEMGDTETSRIALVLSEGYKVVRRFYQMVRPNLEDIPAAPLPEGIEVRPARPEHYRAVWDEMQEAFLDHWGFAPETEESFIRFQNSREFQPELWQIAWAGDQVVGTVLGFIDHAANAEQNRRRGWTEEITVRRPYRGRGIARALIARCLYALKEHGMAEAALGVDTQNLTGALHLYESMGYRPVRSGACYRKPMK